MDFGPSGGLGPRSSVLRPQPSFPQSPCHDPALVSWIVSIYLYMIRCCTEHLAIEVMYLVKKLLDLLDLLLYYDIIIILLSLSSSNGTAVSSS